MRAQVASDFYPVSISCGYRVSCTKALLVDGVSRQAGGASRDELGRARNELGVCLIFSPSLNDLPEKRTMSELFAGFSRHV